MVGLGGPRCGPIFFDFFDFFATPDRTGEKEQFPPYKPIGKQKEKVDFPLVIDLGVFPARSPNPTAQSDHRRNNSAMCFAKETG